MPSLRVSLILSVSSPEISGVIAYEKIEGESFNEVLSRFPLSVALAVNKVKNLDNLSRLNDNDIPF